MTCTIYAGLIAGAWGAVAGGFIALAVAQRWPHVFGLRRG